MDWLPPQPLPIAISAETLDAIAAELVPMLRVGLQVENAKALEALFARYPSFGDTDIDDDFWPTWLADVADWPGELVIEACNLWRRSSEKKPPFTAGLLRPKIQKEWDFRRACQMRLSMARQALGDGAGAKVTTAGIDFVTDGPIAQFRKLLIERCGRYDATRWLDNCEVDGSVLLCCAGVTETTLRNVAGDLLEECGVTLQFAPIRVRELNRARIAAKYPDPPSEEERAYVAKGMRELGLSLGGARRKIGAGAPK